MSDGRLICGITMLCIGIYIFDEAQNYVCIKFFRLDSYIEINLIIMRERTEKDEEYLHL